MFVISTRDLRLLPDVDNLRRTLQSMAMLDAILSRDWEFRYYSFNTAWTADEQLGSMRNGSGDEFFAHFSSAGCWLKGFDHECAMTPYREHPPRLWPGVLEGIPAEFADCMSEPAFSVQNTTFCIYRRYRESTWQIGPVVFPHAKTDPDGSVFLLSSLDGRPESYHSWAEQYYEQTLDFPAITDVYAHRPLTHEIVKRLNPKTSLNELASDISEIGYPQ